MVSMACEYSVDEFMRELVDVDGSSTMARLEKEKTCLEGLHREKSKIKKRISATAKKKSGEVTMAEYDAAIALQDRMPEIDAELRRRKRDQREEKAAAERERFARAEARRKRATDQRVAQARSMLRLREATQRDSANLRLKGLAGNTRIDLANAATRHRPRESTEMIEIRKLVENNTKAQNFREAKRYLGILEDLQVAQAERDAARARAVAKAIKKKASADFDATVTAFEARQTAKRRELYLHTRSLRGEEKRTTSTRRAVLDAKVEAMTRESPRHDFDARGSVAKASKHRPPRSPSAPPPLQVLSPGGGDDRPDTRLCERHSFERTAAGTLSYDAWASSFSPIKNAARASYDDEPDHRQDRPMSSDPMNASFWITTGHLSHGENTGAGTLSPRGPLGRASQRAPFPSE